jgi:hypothetical protein
MASFRKHPLVFLTLFFSSLMAMPLFFAHSHSDRLAEQVYFGRGWDLARVLDGARESPSLSRPDFDEHHIHFLGSTQICLIQSCPPNHFESTSPIYTVIAARTPATVLRRFRAAAVPFPTGVPPSEFFPLFTGLSPPQA